LRAEDKVILGDAGYASDEYKRGSRQFGFLSRADEECCSGEHADGPGQPVLAAQSAADDLRNKSAQNTPAGGDEAETGKIRRQNTAEK